MRARDEFVIKISARASDDGNLIIEGSDQIHSIDSPQFQIAADVLIRVSDYQEEKCKAFRIKSNFVNAQFPFKIPSEKPKRKSDDELPSASDQELPELK